MRRRTGRHTRQKAWASPDADEPACEGEDWVEYGGQLLWAAGWTEAGAPFGLTCDEWRRALRTEESGAGWVHARDVLETLVRLQSPPGAAIELGRVTRVGKGMFREAYAADVEVKPDANALSGIWAVLLPHSGDNGDHDDELFEQPSRELRILAALHRLPELPFRIPRPLGALPGPNGVALAREYLRGIPLDLRAGKQPALPWQVVATVAAGVHGVDAAALAPAPFRAGPATRRDHARHALASLGTLEFAEARDAAAWAAEHLPPEEPAALLHGDLLGQNILIDPAEERPFAAIDWAGASLGDPAYDLAIVTRGVRHPFQIDGGLDRLLEAYNEEPGPHPRVTREQVRLHELCLAAQWCKSAVTAGPQARSESVDNAIARLRRVLSLATSAHA